MLLVPLLMFAIGFLAVLGYFTRERVTWTQEANTKGGVGVAILIFIVFAIIGYFIDTYLHFSLIFQYMFATGGALQAIAIMFWAAFVLMMLSMLWSAQKSGQMVT